MRLVFFGLTIASSWGNGHATCYRGLLRALAARGHAAAFYERRTPWYDANCDLPSAEYCDVQRYESWPPPGAEAAVGAADVVVLGSLAGDGMAIADWLPGRTRALLVYYDIDTPKTLTAFQQSGKADYLAAAQLPRFDLVLSFAGGPALDDLRGWGARRAEAFYCAVDPELHRPVPVEARFDCDLGFIGKIDPDRRAGLDALFTAPLRARPRGRFLLAGPEFPGEDWPPNVSRLFHLNPPQHPAFYSSCRWQLNLTREEMKRWGWSPSVRLFEAGACGAALISDRWEGFADVLRPGDEALLADSGDDVLAALDLPEAQRRRMGQAARARILSGHTYAHRARRFEGLVEELGVTGARGPGASATDGGGPGNAGAPGPR
jgi:spore maturation protein CgeB